jgi:adenylosuccinate lyase
MMRDALDILIKKLSKVIANLRAFSLQWKGNEATSLTSSELGVVANCQACS